MKTTMRKQHDHMEPLEAVSPFDMMDRDGPIWVNKFTEDSARAFVNQLQHQSRVDPNSPIVVHIDSYGGEVYSLLTMVAAMEAVPNQIITVCFGKAMSAGAMLLACGDIRYSSPHSTIMIHEVSGGSHGHVADLHIQHAELVQLNERLLVLLAEKTKIKGGVPALRKVLEKQRDLYLTPQQAVEFGLVDKIGVPTVHRKFSVEYGLLHAKQHAPSKEEAVTAPAAAPSKKKAKTTKA